MQILSGLWPIPKMVVHTGNQLLSLKNPDRGAMMAVRFVWTIGREFLLVGATIWTIEAGRALGVTPQAIFAVGVALMILASMMRCLPEN